MFGLLQKGYKIHNPRARNRVNPGTKKNGSLFDERGIAICFKNSFIASAIGCRRPIIDTLLGPCRKWEYPRILRSSKVKNAIEIKISTIEVIKEIKKFKVSITKRIKFIIRS